MSTTLKLYAKTDTEFSQSVFRDGEPFALAGCAMQLKVSDASGAVILTKEAEITDAPAGKVAFKLTAAETGAMTPGASYSWQSFLTDSQGGVHVTDEGSLTVRKTSLS